MLQVETRAISTVLIFAFSSATGSFGFSDLQASLNPIEKHPRASAPFDAVWKKSRLLMLFGDLVFFLVIITPYSSSTVHKKYQYFIFQFAFPASRSRLIGFFTIDNLKYFQRFYQYFLTNPDICLWRAPL
jgi:hypothetical protein